MTETVTESIKVGIRGLSVPHGTHLCGFFRGREERDDIVLPFLREGLRAGDKCLWALETTDRDTFHAGAYAKLDAAFAGGQLDIVLSSDVYFGRGDFSVPDMLDYWDAWGGDVAGRRRVLLRPCRG